MLYVLIVLFTIYVCLTTILLFLYVCFRREKVFFVFSFIKLLEKCAFKKKKVKNERNNNESFSSIRSSSHSSAGKILGGGSESTVIAGKSGKGFFFFQFFCNAFSPLFLRFLFFWLFSI